MFMDQKLIYYLYLHSMFSVYYQVLFLANLAGFPDILNYINRNGGFGTAKAPNLRA